MIGLHVISVAPRQLLFTLAINGAPNSGITIEIAGVDNEAGESRFTGNDVNRQAGNDRGTYEVTVSSDCGAHGPLLYRESPRTLVPYYTFPLRLVGGPVFTQITPQQAQLGDQINVCGDPAYVPPQISHHDFVDFGDTQAELTLSGLNPPCFSATVPDTAYVSGNISLFINGAPSSVPQPFTVLPPTLNTVNPNPAFAGEHITLAGSGFAADPGKNHLKAGAIDVNMISQTGNQIVFELGTATGGPLQLTAVGTHVSNNLPFNVTSWGNSTRLSNANRDADKPVLAVLPDGSAGVAWMDRNHAGGQVRLLFADAKPGDASFRSPITITTDLAGLASAPQKPALAAGADGLFHLIWVNTAGEIRMTSFGRGEMPSRDQLITAPPAGFIFKDPEIAVLGNAINISVTEVPTSGDFNFLLAQTVSADGGTTFGELTNFEGPTPLLGEISLTIANGRMWRAYTKSDGPDQYDQERFIFTQSSNNGVDWSVPTSPDRNHGYHYSIYLVDERPSVSGDGNGAVVAWDSPQDLVDKFVWANAEPYNTEGGMLVPNFIPNAASTETEDGERPTLALDSKGIAYAAWLRREAGTSPDGVSGVPHVHFNRSLDRFATLQFTPDKTPTHSNGAATTVDNRPSLAIDASDNLHLIWLEGNAGNRVVRYMTTANAFYSDSLADDPPVVSAPARELIAVSTENDPSNDDDAPLPNGTLLLDPNNPNELRWIAMSANPPKIAQWNGVRGPSFKPNSASILLVDNQHFGTYLPLESDLGDELIPLFDVASTAHQAFGQSTFQPTIDRAMWTASGRTVAIRDRQVMNPSTGRYEFFPEIFWSDINDPRFATHTLADSSLHSEDNPDASHDGQFFAYERRDSSGTETLRIAQFEPYTELASINDGYYPSWSPSSNTVVFVQINSGNQENTLVEYGGGGANTLLNPGGEIQWPVYRPDGGDIAFQYKSGGVNWTIRLTSGEVVPTPSGDDDTRPVWSPDGQSIVFIRTEKSTQSSQLMRWDISLGLVTQLTNFPSHVVLGGPERQCVAHFGFRAFPCFPGRPVWIKVPQ